MNPMSRLNDLLRELRTKDPTLARDIEREVNALADRRAFGLNFERHIPEVVELPGRKVRKGDKVRVLPPRGKAMKNAADQLWRVVGMDRSACAAKLELLSPTSLGDAVAEARNAPLDDLVVVAQSRDPIYPGLVSTGKVERGGNKPFHTVINAENLHALETLLFTHRGKVDCIYIDPPYNTGAKDWKYNNDYVESDDLYRHSKWLAFMERRLLLAKELLNPADSVLIVTIDEKEYLRLGLLLEQTFPEGRIQMVSAVINRKGNARRGEFSRCEEFLYFIRSGDANVSPWLSDMLYEDVTTVSAEVRWKSLLRLASTGQTSGRFNLFYPLFFAGKTLRFLRAGAPLAEGVDIRTVPTPPGESVLWPISKDGSDGRWSLSLGKFKEYLGRGYIKFGRANGGGRTPYYLMSGQVEAIAQGKLVVIGRDPDGAVELRMVMGQKQPMTIWNRAGHSTSGHGTTMLRELLPNRRFPYPKSLYAVEDAIRFVVAEKPAATILDFFAGSGTTLHAVIRLNKQDGGRRRAIVVTNNEVGAEEQRALREKGLRPGDPNWEQLGICDFITKPRIQSAITGKTPEGDPIKGDYKFTDEFPMADGFDENAEFFTLTYEAPLRVASHREFPKIAPLLWMRAGARGRRIDDISSGWDVADTYGVLADLDKASDFFHKLTFHEDVHVVYIVTDEDRLFEALAQELPEHIEPVRLYESYLRNFEIESGRGAL
jgi:adenine-specific DNA-methyltransferase